MIGAGAAGRYVLAATTTPTPRPADPESVTPGLWGFLVVFVLAIVVWLLMRNMTQRLRRLRLREQEQQAREAGWDGPGGPERPGGPDDAPPATGPQR